MERLTKQSIIYLHILHVVWVLVSYYSRLFGIDAGEEPAKIPVDMLEQDGRTILRFRFNSIPTPNSQNYTTEEIREIMQQYLDYCILPNDKILCPYVGGSTIYDIVEPLFIDRIDETKGIWKIDVVYIDNLLSFKYVQNRKWKGGI